MGEVNYIIVDDTRSGYLIVRRQEGRPDVYYDGYFDDRREIFRLYYRRMTYDSFGDWKPPTELENLSRAEKTKSTTTRKIDQGGSVQWKMWSSGGNV